MRAHALANCRHHVHSHLRQRRLGHLRSDDRPPHQLLRRQTASRSRLHLGFASGTEPSLCYLHRDRSRKSGIRDRWPQDHQDRRTPQCDHSPPRLQPDPGRVIPGLPPARAALVQHLRGGLCRSVCRPKSHRRAPTRHLLHAFPCRARHLRWTGDGSGRTVLASPLR